ncbi:hypothetical protein EST38_g1953 [Candolleomyces aberdarensis]|uniref:NodB homology domain-containing protein n=1 Tax=Candolleomyces aberdarensis TaxID=2316362 RepID=A0A4Q2DU63_9AGAR|nr:hypothetical protein EST38_g1953 [Candolleomyces aberdarensis]
MAPTDNSNIAPASKLVVVVAMVMLVLSCTAAQARPSLEMRQRAQVVTRCTVPGTAALTFDDGPYQYMYDITATLKKSNATATFFFNGNNYGCIYDPDNVKRVKHAYDQGHQIASHTWSHADLTTLSWDKLSSEMQKLDQAIERITGAVPAFIRPPYGNHNDRVLQVAAGRKQTIVLWDLE